MTSFVLYTATLSSITDALIKPRSVAVIGSKRKRVRIPLTKNIDDVVLVSYPNLETKDFIKLKFNIWAIQYNPRHKILKPNSLHYFYEFPCSEALDEFACFKNLRMTKVKEVTVLKDNPKNDVVFLDGVQKVKLTKYFLIES